jgi:hypothetical protein
MLAATSLAIIEGLAAEMGIYRTESGNVALDIWSNRVVLTIEINPALNQLGLHCCDLDSPDEPVCIFSGSNSQEDWRHWVGWQDRRS